MMNSPMSWLGGKQPMIKNLLPLVPEHTCYCEIFGGAGWLLFAKSPSKTEIYNDINVNLVTFFRIIRDRHTNPDDYDRFINYCQWTPNSREEFEACSKWDEEEDQVVRTAKWWLKIRMSYGSMENGTTWAISTTQSASKISRVIKQFDIVADRLRNVHLENRPWDELLERYDAPEVFFYLDPPYLPSTRVMGGGMSYSHEMTEEDHIAFIERLKKCKAKVLLSGYPSELYDTLVSDADWQTKKIPMHKNIAALLKGNVNQKAVEGLWWNYKASTQLELI